MTWTDLTIFDYIVLLIIFSSTLIALVKGFIKSIISALSWVIIISFTYFAHPFVNIIAAKFIANKIIAKFAAIFLSFIIAWIVNILFAGKIVDMTVRIRGGILDRSLGITFGLLRGCFIACFMISFISITWQALGHRDESSKDIIVPKWLKEAKSYNLLNEGNKKIRSIMPESFISEMDKIGKYKKINDLVSREQIIDQLLKSLSKDNSNIIPKEYLNRLYDENIDQNEQNKIIELMLKSGKNNQYSSDTYELLKQLLNSKTKNSNDTDNSQIDEMNKLIDSFN